MPKKKKHLKVAVFDIDGTIFRSSLLIEYIHEMVRMKIMSPRINKEIEEDMKAWLDRKEGYHNYIMSVVHAHAKYLKGVSVQDAQKAVQHVIKQLKDRNYRYTTSLLKKLQQQGYTLITISGSPHHVVEPFAKTLGFDYWFGQVYEEKDGVYTGVSVLDNSIARKDVVLNLWEKDEDVRIKYRASYAIGDTLGDASLLKKVGHPIAFNPNDELASLAQRKGWSIIVERKDVIYELYDFSRKKI